MKTIEPDSNLAALCGMLRLRLNCHQQRNDGVVLTDAESLFLCRSKSRLSAMYRGIQGRNPAGYIRAQSMLIYLDWTTLKSDTLLAGEVIEVVVTLATEKLGNRRDWRMLASYAAWCILAEVDPESHASFAAYNMLGLYAQTRASMQHASNQRRPNAAVGDSCWDFTGDVLKKHLDGLEMALAEILDSAPEPSIQHVVDSSNDIFVHPIRDISWLGGTVEGYRAAI